MVNQIAVFLENKSGKTSRFLGVLRDAGISLLTVTIAESSDYGILRAITDDNEKAVKVLKENGYTVIRNDVLAVEVSGEAGALLKVVSLFDGTDINIEYFYSYTLDDNRAIIVLKVNDVARASELLSQSGVKQATI